MKTIVLHGHLERFGHIHRLDVKSPAEAVRALCVLLKGFKQHVLEHNLPGYKVIVGNRESNEERCTEDMALGTSREEIHIVPVVTGAGPVGKVIVGAILIAVGLYTGNPFLVKMGATLALAGVAQMLAPKPPALGTNQAPNNKSSYVFSQAVNTSGQGECVPYVYGTFEIGSKVGSAGLEALEYTAFEASGSTSGAIVTEMGVK